MIGESLVSSNEDGLDKLAKHARGVLVALAILQLAGGIIYYAIGGISTVTELGIVLAGGVAFGGLAVWARKDPLSAVAVGLGIWLLSVGSAALANPASLFQGLLVKGLIIVGFINGISTGMTYNQLKRTLTATSTTSRR